MQHSCQHVSKIHTWQRSSTRRWGVFSLPLTILNMLSQRCMRSRGHVCAHHDGNFNHTFTFTLRCDCGGTVYYKVVLRSCRMHLFAILFLSEGTKIYKQYTLSHSHCTKVRVLSISPEPFRKHHQLDDGFCWLQRHPPSSPYFMGSWHHKYKD